MKPKISVITSFSLNGLYEAGPVIRQAEVDFAEVYCFMQGDVDQLWTDHRCQTLSSRGALYVMADAYSKSGEVERLGLIIENLLTPAKVVCFATYLPEISSSKANPAAFEAAQKALLFLVNIAEFLNRRGHPITTIEIVGGSSVDGVWRGTSCSGGDTYVVNRLDVAVNRLGNNALTRLAERLKTVCEELCKRDSIIRFAIELEPGPLFNISNKESLLMLSHLIQDDPFLNAVVGFNLDIPHWGFLEGITSSWLYQHPQIMNRVLHAHICDHSSGHFSDVELHVFHGASHYAPWLNLLSVLNSEKRIAPRKLSYSGFLSCEMECSPDAARVVRSVKSIKSLVDHYCP